MSFVSQEVLLDLKETHLTCTDKNSKLVSRQMCWIYIYVQYVTVKIKNMLKFIQMCPISSGAV